RNTTETAQLVLRQDGNCVTGEATMRTKSLNSEKMEARVARFNKLQTYQRQNFEAHGIPPGAVEKITARRVYPVMAPADYQGRSVGARQRPAWPDRQHRGVRAG